MRYVLGVDGGGSKCDAVLMDETGAVHGWGRGGSAHRLYVGGEAATRSVRDAVTGAVAALNPPIDRVAGVGLHPALPDWLGQPLALEQFVSSGEVELGFATAMTTHGILVLSGTGSFVHGRTPDGRSVHEGGQGPVIADEGSAYHIGILGIRAAFRSHYNEGRRTSLATAVPSALGARKLGEVFNLLYVERIGRSQIASVARTVNEEAESGDHVAVGVLRRGAEELAELVVEVIRALDMQAANECLVATGSVAQGSRIFWERLCEIALAAAPGLRPVQPAVRPVMGACLLALRDLGVEWNQALMDRIVETSERIERTPNQEGQ